MAGGIALDRLDFRALRSISPVTALLLAAALCAAGAPAPAIRVAVMPVQTGEGAVKDLSRILTDAIAAEVKRVPGTQVVTQADVQALLSLEKQRQLLGCAEDMSCMAEIGGALGVENLLLASVGKLGTSWLFHLKLIDVK